MTPKWTRRGMAARAMISKNRFTVFVEGKNFDAPFYDRLLAAAPELVDAGVEIVRSYDVGDSGNASASGGKSTVLALFEFYSEHDKLIFHTKGGPKFLVFFMDRDYDDFAVGLQSSRHIVYTYGTDVEAEIFRRGRMGVALSTALHLTSSEASELAERIGDFSSSLALLWRDWIKLCVGTVVLRSRCEVRPSLASLINKDRYGELEAEKLQMFRERVIATAVVEDPETRLLAVEERVDGLYNGVDFYKLLKGKWLAGYIEHMVLRLHQPSNNQLRSFSNILTSAMLDSIDFRSAVSHHHRRLLELVD